MAIENVNSTYSDQLKKQTEHNQNISEGSITIENDSVIVHVSKKIKTNKPNISQVEKIDIQFSKTDIKKLMESLYA